MSELQNASTGIGELMNEFGLSRTRLVLNRRFNGITGFPIARK
ncbi:MAG: hypothetical protein AAFN77_15370 [Planctomycetota bacterium]